MSVSWVSISIQQSVTTIARGGDLSSPFVQPYGTPQRGLDITLTIDSDGALGAATYTLSGTLPPGATLTGTLPGDGKLEFVGPAGYGYFGFKLAAGTYRAGSTYRYVLAQAVGSPRIDGQGLAYDLALIDVRADQYFRELVVIDNSGQPLKFPPVSLLPIDVAPPGQEATWRYPVAFLGALLQRASEIQTRVNAYAYAIDSRFVASGAP